MYSNDREDVAYHRFVKGLREYQEACRELVGEGLCSPSAVGRVETGDRLLEKMTRDRISSRLGISADNIEEYLRIVEYDTWQTRARVLDYIYKKDVDAAQKLISEYEKTLDADSRVAKQFVETMRFLIYQIKGMHDDTLGWQLYLAIHYTVPSIEMALLGTQLLGEQELGLLIEYFYYCEYRGTDSDEWRLNRLKEVYKYIEESYLDMYVQAKLYPQIACRICEVILRNESCKEDLMFAYSLCTQAIEMLSDARRLYYLYELLEFRSEIATLLLSQETDVEIDLKENQKRDEEWLGHLKEAYEKYGLLTYTENIAHLFIEAESYNVGEVMYRRRRMFKMTRKKVAEGSCTDKTIERAELQHNSPTLSVIRDVFEKLGMCPEYKRTSFIVKEMDELDLVSRMEHALDVEDYEKASEYVLEVKEFLDMDVLHNEQAMMRIENIIAYKTGKIKLDEFTENVMDAIFCTLTEKALWKSDDKFFTKTELEIITDMALYIKGRNAKRAHKIVQKFCDSIMIEEMHVTQFSRYAALLLRMAKVYERYEETEKATQMKEMIRKKGMMHRCYVECFI